MLLFASCKKTVLEFPVNGGVDPTLVNITLNLSVDPKIEPYTPAQNKVKADETVETHDIRWFIEIFKDKIDGQPVAQKVISCDPDTEGNHSIQTSFSLNAAKYFVVAWMDYVDNGSTDDKYYLVDNLASIRIPEIDNYVGDEEHKDCYVANEIMDLTAYRDRWGEEVVQSITLQRPMAKIEFITTDMDKLIDELVEQQQKSNRSLSDKLISKTPDLSSIQVKVEYAGYFPSGFNVYTNKPNDAVTGMAFQCYMTPLSDKEARLGSDYIFVNGDESAVTVHLSISDDQGNSINRIENINVPIVRGKLTSIRDEFLTNDYAPGIGIDTDFEGDINIVIPD